MPLSWQRMETLRLAVGLLSRHAVANAAGVSVVVVESALERRKLTASTHDRLGAYLDGFLPEEATP